MLDSAFEEAAQAARERHGVPALALGVLDGGRVEVAGFGCDADAVFRIASVTKPFTATLALLLLGLSDPAEAWPDVQVSHLLSHTSGYDGEFGDLRRFGDGEDALGLLATALPELRPRLPPGEAWAYANTGYWLAGWLAARRNGTTYEDALAEHLLDPIGLASTSFDGGRSLAGGEAAGPYPRARRPGGGLESNVEDLLRFGAWQLEDSRTRILRQPVVRTPGGPFGLGLALERVGDAEVWGHRGSAGGFESSWLIVPDRAVAFVGLTNSSSGSLALRELEDEVFERTLGARRAEPPRVRLPRSELDQLAGPYRHPEVEAAIAVGPEGDGLVLDVVEIDYRSGARAALTGIVARPIGGREFAIEGGRRDGSRFDFLPASGDVRFARIFSRLAERMPDARRPPDEIADV